MKFVFPVILTLLASTTLAKSFLPTSFYSAFTQEYVSKVSGKKVTTKGELSYLYPGHLKLAVKSPDEVLYVANPKKSWYYTPPFAKGEPGEVKISDSPDNVLGRFFNVLQNGLKDNKNYSVAKGKTGGHVLNFKDDAAKRLGIKEAVLFFKGSSTEFKNLERLKIKDSEDQVKDFTLSGLDANRKIEKSEFEFTPPENTRISR